MKRNYPLYLLMGVGACALFPMIYYCFYEIFLLDHNLPSQAIFARYYIMCSGFIMIAAVFLLMIRILVRPEKRWEEIAKFIFVFFLDCFLLWSVLPPLGSAREKARRIACGSNLKQITFALRMYYDDYKAYPPYEGAKGLELLREGNYLTDPEIYICSSVRTKQCHEKSSLTEDHCSYLYFPPQTWEGENPLILADKSGNHGKKYRNEIRLEDMK